MNVYELREPRRLEPRAHPWVGSATDPSHRHHDFVAHPEHIRGALEDLTPLQSYPAIETLYRLIEWLNGPDSQLMTNDCAFSAPGPHGGDHSTRRLEASGRVMVLFRDLERNTEPQRIERLAQALAAAVAPMEPGFEDGVLAVSVVDATFTTLSPPRLGQQLLVSFWGWGDDPFAAMFAVDRTLACLASASRSVARV